MTTYTVRIRQNAELLTPALAPAARWMPSAAYFMGKRRIRHARWRFLDGWC